MSGSEAWAARLLGIEGWRLVLASQSPRRAELLRGLGLPIEVRPAHVPETLGGDTPARAAERLAREKAQEAAREGKRELVVGADTLVVVDGRALGKPRSAEEARDMLESLSNREHEVMTGVAVVRGDTGAVVSGVETTRVRFGPLAPRDVEILVASGESRDKAGAYGIQGLAGLMVESLTGDYFNVVGLPLALLRKLLQEATTG